MTARASGYLIRVVALQTSLFTTPPVRRPPHRRYWLRSSLTLLRVYIRFASSVPVGGIVNAADRLSADDERRPGRHRRPLAGSSAARSRASSDRAPASALEILGAARG